MGGVCNNIKGFGCHIKEVLKGLWEQMHSVLIPVVY